MCVALVCVLEATIYVIIMYYIQYRYSTCVRKFHLLRYQAVAG